MKYVGLAVNFKSLNHLSFSSKLYKKERHQRKKRTPDIAVLLDGDKEVV